MDKFSVGGNAFNSDSVSGAGGIVGVEVEVSLLVVYGDAGV